MTRVIEIGKNLSSVAVVATSDLQTFVHWWDEKANRVLLSARLPEHVTGDVAVMVPAEARRLLSAIKERGNCPTCGATRPLIFYRDDRANEDDTVPAPDLVVAIVERTVTYRYAISPGPST